MKQPEKNKKDLDSYFDLARNEKVTYSKEDSRKLIAARVAIGSAGLFGSWGIKSLLNANSLSIIGAAAISSVLIYNAMKDDNSTHKSVNKTKISNEVVSNISADNNINSLNNLKPSTDNKADNSLEENNNISKNNEYMNAKVQSSKVINAKNSSGKNIKLAYNYKSNSDDVQDKNNDLIHENNPNVNNTNNIQTDNLSETTENERSIQATNSNGYLAINESKLPSSTNYATLVYNQVVTSPQLKDIPETDPYGELQTILDDFSHHNGFSLTCSERTTTIGGKTAILSGGRMVLTMNKETSVGLFGYGLTNASIFTFKNNDGIDVSGNMQHGYGGVYYEHTFNSENWIHWGINGAVGFGASKMSSLKKADLNFNAPWIMFYTLEPGVNVEVNVFSWMRVGFDLSYRLSGGLTTNKGYEKDSKLNDFKLSALSTGLYFKFGMF